MLDACLYFRVLPDQMRTVRYVDFIGLVKRMREVADARPR